MLLCMTSDVLSLARFIIIEHPKHPMHLYRRVCNIVQISNVSHVLSFFVLTCLPSEHLQRKKRSWGELSSDERRELEV